MVRSNLSQPYTFAVITDQVAVMGSAIEYLDGWVPDTHWRVIAPDPTLPGWWQKLHLFKPRLFTGRVLYLDLDVVVTSSLDELVEHRGIIQDWNYNAYNSSVMAFDAGEHEDIWTTYENRCEIQGNRLVWSGRPKTDDPKNWATAYNGDQDYITAIGNWRTFPPEWCVSYRGSAIAGPPPGAKVVCFHGRPKQAQVVAADPHGWVANAWR